MSSREQEHHAIAERVERVVQLEIGGPRAARALRAEQREHAALRLRAAGEPELHARELAARVEAGEERRGLARVSVQAHARRAQRVDDEHDHVRAPDLLVRGIVREPDRRRAGLGQPGLRQAQVEQARERLLAPERRRPASRPPLAAASSAAAAISAHSRSGARRANSRAASAWIPAAWRANSQPAAPSAPSTTALRSGKSGTRLRQVAEELAEQREAHGMAPVAQRDEVGGVDG